MLATVVFLMLGSAISTRAEAAQHDPWWGEDKALHFSVSTMLALDAYAGASLLTRREGVRVACAASAATAAGIAKEVYDRYAGGDPSLRDLTWDVVGAATGAMTAWLVDHFLFRSLIADPY